MIYHLIDSCKADLDEALKQYQSGHMNIWYECNKKDSGEIVKVCFPGAIDCPEYDPDCCKYRDKELKGIDVKLSECIMKIIEYMYNKNNRSDNN